MKSYRRGYAGERAIAQRYGLERTGLTGKPEADIYSKNFAIESKSRTSLPNWLFKAISQVERACKGKLPIVVLHQLGMHHKNDLVVMRLSTFDKIMEKLDGIDILEKE